MNAPRTYATPTAFRVAWEERLKALAQREGVDFQRLRRQTAFDRLLCRLFARPDAPWPLNGGYAMELRLRTARTRAIRETFQRRKTHEVPAILNAPPDPWPAPFSVMAAPIDLAPGEEVQWELLDRGELHLVRPSTPAPSTKSRARR